MSRCLLGIVISSAATSAALADHPVRFEVKLPAIDANEGCDIADLDGDGKDELITGKRIRAHNGNDPDSAEPPIMRYYVWDGEKKAFDAYTINKGEVGAGLQIRTADLDADGDIDIVVAGKEGTQILFNKRR